jgi:SAM-dependent methyltransferase
MRQVINSHTTPPAAYAPRAACAHLSFCSGFGACFVGKRFCAAGRSGPDCATISPVGMCSMLSDACFRHPTYGSPRVSKERWFRAQLSEKDYWADAARASDDNDNAGASYELFEGYAKVPSALGNVLELGCGPFTQLKSLLGNAAIPWSVSSVTLADPILVSESKHPRSSFQSGSFEAHGKRYSTKLLQIGAEEVGQLYHDSFDTVIMQNVLEHVQDAFAVLESMYNATKVGGVVVFWEPMYGNQWSGWSGAQGQELLIDMNLPLQLEVASPNWNDLQVRDSIRSRAFDFTAHPIRVDPSVFDYFASLFEPIMLKRVPGRRGDNSIILIGRKKVACAKPYF